RCEVRIIDIQKFFATPFSHFFSVFYQAMVFYTKSGQKLFFIYILISIIAFISTAIMIHCF
ncbi:hypothetical protein, partial [Testudinibacter aquarius]|uniref:hypothetical protein n=1 Tax=Testudinibacter aquarius TaxID=1524974 RepID=UPI001AD8016A